jgi:branched-subunit amino acid transport protein
VGPAKAVGVNSAWVLVGGCTVVTAAIKGAGPFALGGRPLPGWLLAIIGLLAPALLAALVATNALADGRHLKVGAVSAGVLAAGLVRWRRGSVAWCVVSAAAVTALVRALGWAT